jgi:hypothetical protein
MNIYQIKIDGKYFAGISEREIGKAAAGGWYDKGKAILDIVLVPDREKAKTIEGNINLKSYWERIYELIRYGDLKFEKIEIVRVEDGMDS